MAAFSVVTVADIPGWGGMQYILGVMGHHVRGVERHERTNEIKC